MQIHNPRLPSAKVLALALMLAAWVAGCAAVSLFAQGREASEYQIKAAFVYGFAKFIEWPPERSGGASDPMTICVVGEDPFGSQLDEFVKGKTVNGRSLAVRRLKPEPDLRGCQIAFISLGEKTHLQAIFRTANQCGVLTVGESKGFAALGGIIDFILEESTVHFEINIDAAQRANLKISSKLLSLAKIVKEQNPEGKN